MGKGERWLFLGGVAILGLAAGLALWLAGGAYREWVLGFGQASWRKLLAVAVIAIVDIALLDAIQGLISRHLGRLGLGQELTSSGLLVVRWTLLALGIVLVLDLLGFRGAVQALLGTAGVVGIAVGLGARDVAANIISGVFIVLDNYFRIGDRIKVGTVSGRVVAIRPRYVLLAEDSGEALVIVPNITVIGQFVWNYSRQGPRAPDEDTKEANR